MQWTFWNAQKHGSHCHCPLPIALSLLLQGLLQASSRPPPGPPPGPPIGWWWPLSSCKGGWTPACWTKASLHCLTLSKLFKPCPVFVREAGQGGAVTCKLRGVGRMYYPLPTSDPAPSTCPVPLLASSSSSCMPLVCPGPWPAGRCCTLHCAVL